MFEKSTVWNNYAFDNYNGTVCCAKDKHNLSILISMIIIRKEKGKLELTRFHFLLIKGISCLSCLIAIYEVMVSI